jgi:C4-dicarboxylate-specific signal transduction histidine kinase
MLAATFIIAFLLHCLVSKRLARLTQIAEKITSGNLDVRTGISGHDELARLGNAFDDMVTRLKKDIHRREAAENELRKLNESLEQHIEERTRELNEKKQQLFDSQAMAHQANKMTALGEMASGIAHEINSPLQSILLFTYRLKRVVSREDYSSITGTLEKIDKSVDMITNIVESLRKMSRDSTNDPFAPECINDIVNDVLALTPVRYQLNGIRFSVNFNQLNKDTTLECQRIRIGQIIVNLLNNAFDAALETEEKWIDLGINEDSNTISITVTDSGNGIAPEIRGKIFEPMFTTKDIGKGTGLGLSISSEIARQHNGSLSIDPKSMHTKFILTLPKKQEVKQD